MNREDDHRPTLHTSRAASRFRRASDAIKKENLKMTRITIGLVSALSLLSTFGCSGGNVRASAPPSPPVGDVAPVVQRTAPVVGEWVGTLEAYVHAQMQPRVRGYLIQIDHHERS